MTRSRRWFLSAVPLAGLELGRVLALADKTKPVPTAVYRYNDLSTEFPVVRLTDPAFTSLLPAHYGRAMPRRGNFLLFSSDQTGSMAVYRMEARGHATRQLTEFPGLDPASLTLTPDERSFCCVADRKLLSINLANAKTREVYHVPDGWETVPGMSLAGDALYAALIERNASDYRLRLIRMSDGTASTLAQAPEPMSDPIPRPKRASVLYSRGGGLWLVNYDGQQDHRLKLADGETGPAEWSPDGRTVLYLNYPAVAHKLHNIREATPDTNGDAWIADTTQFVAFERNGDASVFVGASGTKASPHVLLLVRAVKRELTLCEHRASDPRMVSPIFSPMSQDVFFGSDQHGKPAIYTIGVEKFVSETDSTQ